MLHKNLVSFLVLNIILVASLALPSSVPEGESAVITISKTNTQVPKVLTVKETGLGQVMQGKYTFARGFEVPLVAVVDNGKISQLYDEKYPDKSTFQLGSYNPR